MSASLPRQRFRSLCLLALLAAVPSGALAEAAPLLVTTDWLAARLAEPDLVVLHIGRKADYESQGHLPGARLVPLADLHLTTAGELNDELPPLDKLRAVFESLGVGDESRIVLCPADAQALLFGGRVLAALDLLGCGDAVRLLDGGLPLWLAEKRPVETGSVAMVPGKITAVPRPEVIPTAAQVSEWLQDPTTLIVDARPPDRYTGREADHHAGRPGHIAGAVNVPFYALVREGEDARFLPAAELTTHFDGAVAGGRVVVYCGTGIWAGQVYLAARILGFDARLYDGSYQEWSADPARLITGPVAAENLE